MDSIHSLITLEDLSGALNRLTRDETINLRSQHIPSACKLHFEKSPMKVVRANAQYLYDDGGNEYLDCVNCVAHVGHCNPAIVAAAKTAMLQMGSISLGMSDTVSEYVSQLRSTFPSEIDTFLFVSSGSEANDLAIQMARLYTGALDVVSVDRSFHGGITLPNTISSHQFTRTERCPEWVHVLQCPDLYRGKYQEMDAEAEDKYCREARKVMEDAVQNKRKLSCFICEPILTKAGVIVPPSQWLHSVYRDIRSFGGLAIADEAQTGLGRIGTSMWSFQLYDDLVPDIITIGKPLGNGHPMACIATRSHIASSLLAQNNLNEYNYACDLVSAAVGLAVLNTIRSLSLQANARTVGDFLREGIRSLRMNHQNIGQVRGMGLMIGVEIVYNQQSRKPARDIAEQICYKLLEHFIIVANSGPIKNILVFTPPMCFTCENAHRVILALDKTLKEIEELPGNGSDGEEDNISARSSSARSSISGERIISLEELVNIPAENEQVLPEGMARISPRNEAGMIMRRTSTPTSLSYLTGSYLGEAEDDDGGYATSTSNSFASMD